MNKLLLKYINSIASFYIKGYKFFHYHKTGMFDSINIETMNMCNRRCLFCPVSYYSKERVVMTDKLFSKIINELSALRFCGRISLHLYNEPLLDTRLPELIKEARNKCPQSFIVIYSNGDLITLKLFRDLIKAGIDLLRITQYESIPSKSINDLLKNISNSEKKSLNLVIFDKTNICNRAGALPNIQIAALKSQCFLPKRQLIISASGNILVCCNDYFEKMIMGNCNNKKIINILNEIKFKKLKAELALGNRSKYFLCSQCNYLENKKTKMDHEIFSYRHVPLMYFYEKLIFKR